MTIEIPTIPIEMAVGLAFAALAILAVCAVFSPLLRVKLRRSLLPVSVAFIGVMLFAGYFTATGSGS